MKATYIICIIININNIVLANDNDFKSASSVGAIGEVEHMHLAKDGINISTFYNDFLGATDKYLTGGAKISLLNSWNNNSLETKLSWRFLTPAIKKNNFSEKFDKPIGRYADWGALQNAFAHIFEDKILDSYSLKLQATVGIDQIGKKNAKQVHTWVHKEIGSSLDALKYTNQPEGLYLNYGLEAGIISQKNKLSETAYQYQLTTGYNYNLFMEDMYIRLNYIITYKSETKQAIEFKYIKQIKSKEYSKIKQTRYEISTSIQPTSYYRPGIKYVSSYLEEDNVGQVVIDPFVFHIDF